MGRNGLQGQNALAYFFETSEMEKISLTKNDKISCLNDLKEAEAFIRRHNNKLLDTQHNDT